MGNQFLTYTWKVLRLEQGGVRPEIGTEETGVLSEGVCRNQRPTATIQTQTPTPDLHRDAW